MLMNQAMKNGVKLVACTMSMDVMGIRKEEIIDGVELPGGDVFRRCGKLKCEPFI